MARSRGEPAPSAKAHRHTTIPLAHMWAGAGDVPCIRQSDYSAGAKESFKGPRRSSQTLLACPSLSGPHPQERCCGSAPLQLTSPSGQGNREPAMLSSLFMLSSASSASVSLAVESGGFWWPPSPHTIGMTHWLPGLSAAQGHGRTMVGTAGGSKSHQSPCSSRDMAGGQERPGGRHCLGALGWTWPLQGHQAKAQPSFCTGQQECLFHRSLQPASTASEGLWDLLRGSGGI